MSGPMSSFTAAFTADPPPFGAAAGPWVLISWADQVDLARSDLALGASQQVADESDAAVL